MATEAALTITYEFGSREDLEAEYGYDVVSPAGVIEFINGDFSQFWPYDSLETAAADHRSMVREEAVRAAFYRSTPDASA